MDLPMLPPRNPQKLQEQWEEESEFLPVSLEQLMEELLSSTERSRLRMKIRGCKTKCFPFGISFFRCCHCYFQVG